MILEILGVLFGGGAAMYDLFSKTSMTEKLKKEGINNGKKTYTDFNNPRNVRRSVQTNEICTFQINYGHRQMVGVKTHKVYQDFTQEKLDAKNAELRRAGKKFYYKDFTQWTLNGHALRMRVETATGKPYEIACIKTKEGRKYTKRYYDMNSKYLPNSLGSETIWLTKEEGLPLCESENEFEKYSYREVNG